jgi:hypothetical protein
VDADGDLDLVSVSFGSGDGIHVYLNEMDGTWTRSFGFLGGNCNMIVRFGDVNGDGHPDIAADHQAGTVWFGDGTGDFTLADGNLPEPGSWGNYYGTDLGDVDGDGRQELSFTLSTGAVHVWKWKPGNRWTSLSQGLPASSDYSYTQLCDMDCNGTLDLVTAGDGIVTVWIRENQVWHEAHSFTLPSQLSLEAFRAGFDVDFNGRPDIVMLSEEGSWPSYQNKMRFFKESTPASRRRLRITYPRGKETLIRGAVCFIHWLAAVPDGMGGTSTVDLALSTDGPGGPWTDLATGLPNNGRYQWHIAPALPASMNGRIRIRLNTPVRSAQYTMIRSFTLQ